MTDSPQPHIGPPKIAPPPEGITDPDTLALALYDTIGGLDRNEMTEGPLTDVALRYWHVRGALHSLLEIAQDLEQRLIDDLPSDLPLVLPHGVGAVKREPQRRSTWNNVGAGETMRHDLVEAVARVLAMDIATGELDQLKANVARAAARETLDAVGSVSNLLAAACKRLGLDMGDYRSWATSYKVVVS